MKFRFSGTLMRFVDYQREVQVDASTLGTAIDELARRFPDLKPVLLDAEGRVRKAHSLFLHRQRLNDTNLDQKLNEDDCVEVLTLIAGG